VRGLKEFCTRIWRGVSVKTCGIRTTYMSPQTDFWRQLFVYTRRHVLHTRDMSDHFERDDVARSMHARIGSRRARDVNLKK
jgi:hypothetical protein